MKQSPIQRKAKTQIGDELNGLRQRLVELEASMAENLKTVAALQESERNYRILLDESSDPIFTFYPDGQYRYVNKAFANGVGRNLNEIMAKKSGMSFHKMKRTNVMRLSSGCSRTALPRLLKCAFQGRMEIPTI